MLAISANALDTSDYTSTFKGADGFVYGVVNEGFGTCEIAYPDAGGDLDGYGNLISGDLLVPEYVTDPSTGKEYMVIGIGVQAFYKCDAQYDKYWTLTLPNSILTIDDWAFAECELLQKINFGSNLTSIGADAFYKCSEIGNLRFPDSLEEIGNYAFYGMKAMTTVVIPESVTTLGDYSFCGDKDDTSNPCSIERFVVGPDVEKLNGRVLGYNNNLKVLVLNFPVPPTNESSNLFSNTDVTITTIYVPDESLDAYKACDDWNNNYAKWQFKALRPLSELEVAQVTLSFPEETYTVEVGEEFTLPTLDIVTEANPEEASLYLVYTVTGDEGIAEVSEDGQTVTFNTSVAGSVTVTASLEENYFFAATPAEFVLTVKAPETPDQPGEEPGEEPGEDDGVDGVLADDAPAAVYNLAGCFVGNSTEGLNPGVYVVRQGNKALKVVVK